MQRFVDTIATGLDLFTPKGALSERDRYQMRLAVIVCDLDQFKTINYAFGHRVGDKVLQDAARTLSESIRNNDVVSRVGGEEFVVILPGTELDSGVSIAERIRKSVADMSINNSQTANIKISVSIGVCEWKLGEKFESAVSRADTLLYKAKAAGRNLVAS